MGSTHVRLGSLLTTAALLALAVAHEADPEALARLIGLPLSLPIQVALVAGPIALLLVGLRQLAIAARHAMAAASAGRLARILRDRLPEEYVILPRYRPRDSGDDEVGLVVIGPPGVVVIEARDDPGEIVCYQDHWFRQRRGSTQRIEDSPSKRARWNSIRVRNDIALGGFVRTPVEPLVVFTRGRVSEASSSSVTVLEGPGAVLAYLQRLGPKTDASPQRTRALADALVGSPRVALA